MRRTSGSTKLWVVVALAVLAIGGGTVFWLRLPREIFFAAGAKGAPGQPTVGESIAEIIAREVPSVRVKLVTTKGSVENLALVNSGAAQLAIVQNDTPGVTPAVRSIAPLFEEVLQVVVREDGPVHDLLDLKGKVVSVGAAGGGTEDVSKRVLDHFGLLDAVTAKNYSGGDAIAAFERNEIDAAFFVSGVRHKGVERLLAKNGRLLSLGEPGRAGSALEGIRTESPYLRASFVAARSYGPKPAEPVGTVGALAVLTISRDVDASTAREITRALIENKVALAERHHILARLSDRFDAGDLKWPLHDGAQDYYTRAQPAFYVEYADFVSLCISIVLGVASTLLAIREWLKRRKKNRIDAYYLELKQASDTFNEATANLPAFGEQLRQLKWRAFDQLVKEELEADESFTIFQDLLRSEVARLERIANARGVALDPKPSEGSGAAPASPRTASP